MSDSTGSACDFAGTQPAGRKLLQKRHSLQKNGQKTAGWSGSTREEINATS